MSQLWHSSDTLLHRLCSAFYVQFSQGFVFLNKCIFQVHFLQEQVDQSSSVIIKAITKENVESMLDFQGIIFFLFYQLAAVILIVKSSRTCGARCHERSWVGRQ